MSSNKGFSLNNFMPIIKEKLESGGTVTYTPNGKSMYPMLRDGEDVVILKKPHGRLHLFDVVLYERESGTYALHRVVGFDADGSYVMCGDNQYIHEHGIYQDNIVAVMTAYHRKGKSYTVKSLSYRFYVNLWYYLAPFRRIFLAVIERINAHTNKGNNNENEKNSDGQREN